MLGYPNTAGFQDGKFNSVLELKQEYVIVEQVHVNESIVKQCIK